MGKLKYPIVRYKAKMNLYSPCGTIEEFSYIHGMSVIALMSAKHLLVNRCGMSKLDLKEGEK